MYKMLQSPKWIASSLATDQFYKAILFGHSSEKNLSKLSMPQGCTPYVWGAICNP